MNTDNQIAGFPKEEVLWALENNLWEMWSCFGLAPGCKLHDRDGMLWFDTPISTLPYNTVLRFIVDSNVDRRIDSLIAHYRHRRVPFMWVVHPSSRPIDLPERLHDRGLQEVEVVSGMAAKLAEMPPPPPPPEGIEIHEVSEETEVSDLFELIYWRWHVLEDDQPHYEEYNKVFFVGVPGSKTRCWLAWQEGVPVSKVVLYRAAGAAGIHGVATRPRARRLGLARTLTLTALQAARQEGDQLSVLHSTPMAESLYAKLGYQRVAPFRVFASEMIHI
jgi:GNAT superfamily N-acetyltransferase